jgi:alkyldihydroxyacetonephosphate synthase
MTDVASSRRSFWAWCLESEEPTKQQRDELASRLSERAGTAIVAKPVPKLDDATLRPSRISVPNSLEAWCTTDTWERAFHSHGAHFTDRTRAFALEFPNPPDVVAHPSSEAELAATVDWCGSNGYVVVPFGAGSSVVWGVNPPEADAVVTIALDRLDKVLEIDEVRAAHRGRCARPSPRRPAPSERLHAPPLPAVLPFSSLGGWIAARSGGHYATNQTHIDDFVESVRMITPRGGGSRAGWPGSGAVRHPTGW